jgi:hypothetical protein
MYVCMHVCRASVIRSEDVGGQADLLQREKVICVQCVHLLDLHVDFCGVFMKTLIAYC